MASADVIKKLSRPKKVGFDGSNAFNTSIHFVVRKKLNNIVLITVCLEVGALDKCNVSTAHSIKVSDVPEMSEMITA